MNTVDESRSPRLLHVVRAFDALAHDLRNAMATVTTGVTLMDGAPPDEVAEIAQDMQGPAQDVLVLVDLVVEASRACLNTAAPEPVELHAAVQRSIARARRGGITITGEFDAGSGVQVMTSPSAIERCITAAALYVGTRVTATTHGSALVLCATNADTPSEHRRTGAQLLCDVLADAAGATVAYPDADMHEISLTFTLA